MTKRILVFQHLRIEHPGIFREFFKEDGFDVSTVELDEGETIPDLNNFDALWVMGGPQDVWQEDRYPWLIDEKEVIRKAVNDLNMPFVGICLGHQLLADALGGDVGPGSETEVGIMQIHKTEAGKQNPFLNDMLDTMNCLQWHGAEVKTAPAGMDVLASSDVCGIQSLSSGSQVFTSQYHQEIIPSTVSDWSDIPAYKKALEKALGENAADKLEKEALEYMSDFNKTARQFYENWKNVVF
ncbi:MAG: type 1 glutamine amidotransferase [Proteobacteria bacterium]|nr:type 1 glutamine amidotransferase [Pseudomonadota bacterium]NOG61471.1 type 1 glutamine amidotransferase [Pseudomonadota bacterium]